MSARFPAPRSFPLSGPSGGRHGFAFDDESVRDALTCLLLTQPGERLMRPDFGAGLQRFIHEQNDGSTLHLIADAVRTAVTRHEPRVVLEAVDVEPDASDAATLRVALRYRLRHDGRAGSLLLTVAPKR
jgi:phage baseplate assembly protein W